MNKLFLFFIFLISSLFLLTPYVLADSIVVKNAVLSPARSYLSCAENSLTHKIYCFGGEYLSSWLNQIVEYTPATDQLIVKNAQLPIEKRDLACAENSQTHKIYCFGGRISESSGDTQIVEYDTVNDLLTIKSATLPQPNYGLTCAENSQNYKIYCFGGRNLNTILEYNPQIDILITKNAVLPSARSYFSCIENSLTHKIYCFGGSPYTNQILEYDSMNDLLSIKSAVLPNSRNSMGCAENVFTHKIYCLGGSDGAYLSQILEYTSSTDTLQIQTTALPAPRSNWACAEDSSSSKIYCFGGQDQSGHLSQILEYTNIVIPPLINPPRLLDIPRIGTTVDIELSDPAHPNTDYLLAMSSGNTPGMTLLDNRNIPLNYDALLQASLFSPFSLSLFNSQSRFNNNGVGSAFWNIPNSLGLAGQDLYFGFVTVDLHNPLPQAILSISRSQKIKILPNHFIPDANTVALWNFNENTGDVLTDLSGNGNTGELHGATWTTGLEGSALRFDGVDDYVNVSDSPSLVLTNAFTIEAYVNYEGGLQDTTVDTIVGKDYQYVFGVGDNTYPGRLAFTLANQPSSLCPGPWCDGVAAVPQNAWHHVAVQYDGQTIKTIIDGQTVAEYPSQFTVGSASTALGIGARLVFALDADPVPVAFFKGKIDEVRISNVARY